MRALIDKPPIVTPYASRECGVRAFAIDGRVAGRHHMRHGLAAAGDDDLFAGFDPIEQLAEFGLGLEGPDLLHKGRYHAQEFGLEEQGRAPPQKPRQVAPDSPGRRRRPAIPASRV